MKPEALKLLWDIRRAIEAIQEFTADLTLEAYLEDAKTAAAVERKLEIIGEAFARLRDQAPEIFATMQSAPQIIGLRNRIIHGYDQVDGIIIWDVISRKIPELLVELPPE
jgi:uncharacterized protein with HEPN domain